MTVGVVVPAHDEEDRLPACLAALRLNAARVVVVADACADRTAQVARRLGALVVETSVRNVGVARDLGVRELLRQGVTWVATTDADTVVPPWWLEAQLACARVGWDAVAGTVSVADWSEHPRWLPATYARLYAREAPVHGANLGFTAHAYRAAGGFPPIATGEDRAFVRALERTGHRVLFTATIDVVTSARRRYRAPRGFGHLLTTLEPDPVRPPHP